MKQPSIYKSIAAILLSTLPFHATAEETICNGIIENATVDNVLVPSNSECNLNNMRVLGTIQAATNATITTRKTVVIGNLQAENARQVNVLENSRIGGSVQIKQGGGAIISDSMIDSDIQFESNSGSFQALRNIVSGNVQVFQNIGEIEIIQNTIDGNLQCKENAPAPTGGANTVQGSKEDQCSQLEMTASRETDNKCNASQPTFGTDGHLHIPRLNILTQGGDTKYWATLQYVPSLSSGNKLVFELSDLVTDAGTCNQ